MSSRPSHQNPPQSLVSISTSASRLHTVRIAFPSIDVLQHLSVWSLDILDTRNMPSSTSQAMPPSATANFNPSDVSASDAFTWCQGQRNACPLMCGGSTFSNTCDSVAFTYSCICGDGSIPNFTAYTQTLPCLSARQHIRSASPSIQATRRANRHASKPKFVGRRVLKLSQSRHLQVLLEARCSIFRVPVVQARRVPADCHLPERRRPRSVSSSSSSTVTSSTSWASSISPSSMSKTGPTSPPSKPFSSVSTGVAAGIRMRCALEILDPRRPGLFTLLTAPAVKKQHHPPHPYTSTER